MTRIGAYTLTGRRLGSGAFGDIFEATHPDLDLRVAIKVQSIRGADLRDRALREAAALARIQHRNVVRIFDAGELPDGQHYLAMELLTGEPLSTVLADGPLPRDRAAAWIVAIANALDAVHARGLVHRDLKPSNIFLCRDDDGEIYPKLIDFGIAKDLAARHAHLTQTGAYLGSPQYSSPEQWRGDRELDTRSDVYALGVLAFHMIAGRPPYDGEMFEVAHQHVHGPVPLLGEPPLDAVLARLLAKQPEERPGAASDAAALLADVLRAPPVRAPAPRRRVVVAGGLLLALALAGAGLVRAWPAAAARDTPIDAAASDAAIDAAHVDGPLPVDASAPPIDAPRRRAIPRPATAPAPGIDDVESLPDR